MSLATLGDQTVFQVQTEKSAGRNEKTIKKQDQNEDDDYYDEEEE